MNTAKDLVDGFKESIALQFEGVVEAADLPAVADMLLTGIVEVLEISLGDADETVKDTGGDAVTRLNALVAKKGEDHVIDAFTYEAQRAATAMTIDLSKEGLSKEAVNKLISNSRKLVQ